jgi:ABC-2 type transport system permease protein
VSLGGLDWGRLLELMRKELRQTVRDPRTLRLVLAAPIIQLIVFGYAVNTDIRRAAVILFDRDHTSVSRALAQTLAASGHFRIVATAERAQDLVESLDHGRAILGVEIPRGFEGDLAAGTPARVQVLVDGTMSNTATVAQAYASQIILKFGQQHSGTVARTGGKLPGVDLRVRSWYNPNLESRVYNVPGVMGSVMMLMSLLLTSLAVVREREVGTLEQLMVSPLTPVELILGKTVPVVGIALVDLTLIASVAILWFGIPMRGSFLLLFVASLVYIVCGLGIGLLISTVSATTQEAFMTMFMFFLPAMIFSGFFFPIANMPAVFQLVSLLDPIRYYLATVRGIFLKGAGLTVLWPQIAALAVMGGLILWLASTRFRKTSV